MPDEAAAPVPVKEGAAAEESDDEDEEEDGDDEEEEGDGGPDPEEAARRFSAVAEQQDKVQKALKKHGRGSKQVTDELAALAELFMPIKLVPKQYDALVIQVRSALDQSALAPSRSSASCSAIPPRVKPSSAIE